MNNNLFKFSPQKYFIRFGIIELLLIIGSAFIIPAITILLLFIFFGHLMYCSKQLVTLDPFQIEINNFNKSGIGPEHYNEKNKKYYYINKMTNYKTGLLFITIHGNIEFRKKENINGCYTEKTKKINKVRIWRPLTNEKELLYSLKEKLK